MSLFVSCSPAQPSDPGKIAPPVDEIGVYYRNNGAWVALPPEVVNWKTGGVLKNVGTLGIVKGDINGRLRKGISKIKLAAPTVDLLVYAHEGDAIEEYQLIKLREHSDSREFRTVTGGVFHVSGGAERDTMDFDAQHVARRTWKIELSLAPGEYGILPPGSYQSREASAQLGKIYTFSIEQSAEAGSPNPDAGVPFEKPKKKGF